MGENSELKQQREWEANILKALEFLKTGRSAEIILKEGAWGFAQVESSGGITLFERLGAKREDDGTLGVKGRGLLQGAVKICERMPDVYKVERDTDKNGDEIITLSAIRREMPEK